MLWICILTYIKVRLGMISLVHRDLSQFDVTPARVLQGQDVVSILQNSDSFKLVYICHKTDILSAGAVMWHFMRNSVASNSPTESQAP